MINFVNFSTENHLLSLFFGSGLNLIFQWKAQSLIFIKSLFRSFAVEFIFWTTKKREMSTANNFVMLNLLDHFALNVSFSQCASVFFTYYPSKIYSFKVINRHHRKMWNMFKVNNKEMRTMLVTSFWPR